MSESNITTINVSYLSGSRDIKKLKPNTDILICSVFCYKELLNAMPEMEDGLQFVYFSEIDQMCDANGPVAKTILNAFFSRKHRIQVSTIFFFYFSIEIYILHFNNDFTCRVSSQRKHIVQCWTQFIQC